MPVSHSAMANTRAVPSTASRYWRRRNWMLRSVTFHMSTSLHQGGSDEPDPVVVEAGEPDVAVRTGGDPERRPHVGAAGNVGGDLTVGADPADAVLAVGEPQIAVGTRGDGAGFFSPGWCPVERVDAPLRGDAADAVAARAGEPQVAVGAGHDVARERNIGSGGVECGDLPAGRDAPDPAVEVGEPQVPVGTGGDVSGEHNPRGGPAEGDVLAGRGDPTDLVAGGVPEVAVRTDGQTQRAGAMLTDHNRGDLPVRCDASDPAVHGGEPQRPVRP